MTTRVQAAIFNHPSLTSGAINVETFKGAVTHLGEGLRLRGDIAEPTAGAGTVSLKQGPLITRMQRTRSVPSRR